MKKNLLGLFLIISFVLSSTAQVTKQGSPAMKAAEQITAQQLKDYLYFIADDAMQGRDTPSPGLDATANFIAFNLKKWGYKPAGDNGTFFQKMWLSRKSTDTAASSAEINGQKLAYGNDFLALANAGTANGSLVYGGNGWMHKAKGIDALAGVDVKGKIVVLYATTPNGLPAGMTFADLQGGKAGEDWASPPMYAAMKGAVGLIYVANQNNQQNWERFRQQRERGAMTVEKLRDAPAGAATLPIIYISQKSANALFEGETGNPLTNADLKAFEFKGKNATIKTAAKEERVSTQNVVALWEGGDPKLKDEMVAVGAHYDHVGTNPNAPGEDKIWNGADDDGSGTTGVLGIAEALAKSKKRPKRSILFVWHCGEEKGLWGSEYFNKFPTVDIKKVTAQLNIDMIGRSKKEGDTEPRNKDLSGENTIYVIGSNMMSSTLGKIVADTNYNYLKMTYDLRYDDPKDPNRFFFRSDHFNYAVNGIPIAFWFDGVHVDYHQPSDTPDKIDYTKMEKISRTIFLTMWELADLKERPKVDKQLPPELNQR